MLLRFCLYSIFKNLRFFEPFFYVYLLAGPALGGPGLSYLAMAGLVSYQKLVTGVLEVPSGVLADRWGRRRALALCFACYAVAFPVYAVSARLGGPLQLALLYGAQSLFAIGEAFRTGTHKAIMLDWLAETGQSDRATSLIGFTRFFSKTSAALSAVVGGALVFWTRSFSLVFWAATLPAFAGLVLSLTYPRALEGEAQRARAAPGPTAPEGWRTRFRRLWATPGVGLLLGESVLLESQIKLCEVYLQPFLKLGLDRRHVAVVSGAGVLLLAGYALGKNLLGGVSSLGAVRIERAAGGGRRALRWVYLSVLGLVCVLAVAVHAGWLVAGVVVFAALSVLQNARRPIFVSQFDRVMDKPQRATLLSVESQGRTWALALVAPLTGLLADRYGLAGAFALMACLLVAGLALRARAARSAVQTP